MTTVPCGHFPAIDLSKIGKQATPSQKLRRCAPLLRLAPKPIRRQLRRVVAHTPMHELAQSLQKAASIYREVCSHAAFAAIIEPSLAMPFAFTLNETPMESHDLVFSILLQSQDHKEEIISLFLREIERVGLCEAVIDALKRDNLPIFGRKKTYSANNPSAPYIRAFLARLTETNDSPKIHAFAAEHLPLFAVNKTESLALIQKYIQSEDLTLKSIGAWQFSNVCPDSSQCMPLLWDIAERHAFENRQIHNFDFERDRAGKLVLKRIIDMADTASSTEQRAEALQQANQWCNSHIRSVDPVNREVVEENIARLYRAANCAPPAVVWINNPEQAVIAAGLYAQSTSLFVDHLKSANFSEVQRYIWKLKRVVETLPDYVAEVPPRTGNWRIRRNDDIGIDCVVLLRGPHFWWRQTFWNELNLSNGRLSHEVNVSRIDKTIEKLKAAHSSKNRSPSLSFEPDSINFKDLDSTLFWNIMFDESRLGMVGFRSFLRWLGAYPFDDDGLESILENCGGFIPFDDIAIVVERPSKVWRTDHDLLHNQTGLSVEYEDGCGIYAVGGVRIPPRFITNPETITLKEIKIEPNAEIRRTLVDLFGRERFLKESGATIIDVSGYGILYTQAEGWKNFAMVRVINRSPEPDGSFKEYFLDVPPDTKTARQAVAWTFDMEEFEYRPGVET
jgi:hypothetical protein